MFKTVKIVFRWCVFLAFLATAVVAGIAYRRADSEIRRFVQTELQRKFPELNVSFESVRFDSTRGVRILSVVWRLPDAPDDAPPLLEAEEIYVELPLDWNAVKSGNFAPRRIAIARPQMRSDVDAAVFLDNLRRLKPTPSEKPCPVEAFDGAIFFDDPERPNETTTLAGLRLLLTPTPRSAFSGESPLSPEKILDDERLFADDANAPNSPNADDDANIANAPNSSNAADDANIANDANAPNSPNADDDANIANDANVPNRSNVNDDASVANNADAAATVWTLTLSASNPYVQELNVRGCVDGKRWAFRGAARRLDVAAILQRLDAERQGKLGSLRNARGQTSFDFEIADDSTVPDGVRFRVDGELSRGAVASPLLKFPLSDVEIRYSATQTSLEIERFAARSGATTLAGSYRQLGPLSAPSEGALRLRLNDYPLDDAHLKRLAIENAAQANVESEKLRKLVDFLNDYQFSATTNVDLTVEKSARTSGAWRPTNLVISGSGLDLVCVAFPYRLEQLSGRVALDAAGALTIALRSEFNERSLKIDGRFDDALGTPSGSVEIEGLGYPIDARLLSALPPASRAELARLRPSGAFDANVNIDYNPNRAERLQVKTTIGVRDAAIQYDLFPLPISSIGGLIQMEKGAWVFSNLSGKSGAARLRASGSFVSGAALAANNANNTNNVDNVGNINNADDANSPAVVQRSVYSNAPIRPASATFPAAANDPISGNAPRGADFADFVPPTPPSLVDSIPTPPGAPLPPDAWRFELTTNVEDFPLGEELSNALVRYDGRESFEKLGLSGKANGQIRVAYRSDQRKLDVEFDAEPVAGAASMKPASLPYELGDLRGRAFYRTGEFRVDGFRARAGRTTYSANLAGRFAPNGGWTFDVSALRVEQLQLDRDLLSAAPPAAIAFVDHFQPNGFFNVDGAFRLERGPSVNAPLQAAWDLRFVAQQNSFRPNDVPLNNVCGRVKTRGFAVEGGSFAVGGEFDLDSFCWGDLLVSRTTGPFYFDGTDVFWGRDAPPVRRSALYQHPFLRERIDADPLYRAVGIAARPSLYRGQAPNVDALSAAPSDAADAPPGFAPDASTQTSKPRPPLAVPTAPPGLLSNSGANAATLGSGDAASFPGSQPVATVSAADERRPIQARVCDGQATTDGVFYRRQVPTYKVVFNVKNARLADVTREFAPGSKPIQGRVAAYATLRGEGLNVATLKGEGGFSLQDAELYESPQIVKILQILSVREPDQTAFDSAFVDFEVIGERLQLKRVLLEGNALTLFGDGWLTVRDKEKLIDLTLNARLGSASDQIPIVSDFLGGVGDQLAQIRVEGALSSPIIRQERFSGVKKAWWNVFPEQEPTPTDAVPTERPKPLRDALRRLTSGAEKDDKK